MQTATAIQAAPASAPELLNPRCQCCDRVIKLRQGRIALHGYRRPSWGWQTSSCWGAQSLPFQISRDRLGKYIEFLQKHDAFTVAKIADMQAAPKAILIREGRTPAGNVWCQPDDKAFPRVLGEWVRKQEWELTQLRADIAAQQARYDAWVAVWEV